jgi:uncharacterized protein (DUF1015 family)
MADVAPFRAIRYARPSDSVVAPPYDVVSPAEREELFARSPHNVARLTLAESEQQAGEEFRRWLEDGVLVREPEPALWLLEQEYVGPDGVARTRLGIVGSLRAEPYETGAVLPHERTHAGPKESRLRLLQAARAQLEPILLLYDAPAPLTRPARDPDLAVGGSRLWRVADAGGVPELFAGREVLIADGHHRYETALAFHAGQGTPESSRVLAVLVSTSDPGLEIFATHRVFGGRPELGDVADGPSLELADALERLGALPHDRAAAVAYRAGGATLELGDPGQLDVELVDRYGHDGISYTPDLDEAVGRVDSGEADVAFLLRPTRIEDVFARSRNGEVLPPKTTYFFPKLVSGLLFLPLEP